MPRMSKEDIKKMKKDGFGFVGLGDILEELQKQTKLLRQIEDKMR